jgi:hypothetical protein
MRHLRVGLDAGLACNIDDPAALVAPHVWQHCAGDTNYGEDVEIEQTLPIRIRELFKASEACRSGRPADARSSLRPDPNCESDSEVSWASLTGGRRPPVSQPRSTDACRRPPQARANSRFTSAATVWGATLVALYKRTCLPSGPSRNISST